MGRTMDAARHEAWRRRLQRFEACSLTVAEFCRREGVSTAAFYQWRNRLERERDAQASRGRSGAPGKELAGFVELTVPTGAAMVELELPNGVRVRLPTERESLLGVAIRAAGQLPSGTEGRNQEVTPC